MVVGPKSTNSLLAFETVARAWNVSVKTTFHQQILERAISCSL